MSAPAEPGEGHRRNAESLGWLTESTIMPKKQRVIEGVGASTIVNLRAQLYKSQEEMKMATEGGEGAELLRAKKKGDLFSHKNAGVLERDQRDKLQLKSVEGSSDSYAALERKAILYDKMAKGQMDPEEEKEKYNVDFFSKGTLEEEAEEMERERNGQGEGGEREEGEERRGPPLERGVGLEHKQLIREVNAQTREARVQTSELKRLREAQALKKRERLKHAFLKSQMEKLKVASRGKEVKGAGVTVASGTHKL